MSPPRRHPPSPVEVTLRGVLAAMLLFLLASGLVTFATGAHGPALQALQFTHALVALVALVPWVAYVLVHVSQILENPRRTARRAALLALVVVLVPVTRARIGIEHNERLNTLVGLSIVGLVLFVVASMLRVMRRRGSPWAAGVLFLACCGWTALSGLLVLPGADAGSVFYDVHVASIAFLVAAAALHVAASRRRGVLRSFPWRATLGRVTLPLFLALCAGATGFSVFAARTTTLPPADERSIVATDRGFLEVSTTVCDACHPTVVDTWSGSSHAHAATNPVFTALLRRTVEAGRREEARQCLRCHAPHAADPTRFDLDEVVDSEGYRAGVHCVSCHRVDAEIGERDGDLRIRPFSDDPSTFLVERSGPVPDLMRANRFANVSTVSARLERHLDHWRGGPERPLACRPCHVQTLDPLTHGRLDDVLQDQYVAWTGSPAAEAGVDCITCHMRPVYGDEGYVLEDHRFATASTYVARIAAGDEGEAAVVASLEGGWVPPRGSVEPPEHETRPGKEAAPAASRPRPAGSLLSMTVELVVTESGPALRVETSNRGAIGHDFPNAPTDLVQVWLRIRAVDESGAVLLDEGAEGPADAVRLGHRLLDARGAPVREHRLWEVAEVVDLGRVPAEGTHVVERPLAAAPRGAVEVEAAWRYRRLDPALVEALGAPSTGLPVVTIARFAHTLPGPARTAER